MFPFQSIQHYLQCREMGSHRFGTELYCARQLYRVLVPNTTVMDVDSPVLYKRFTRDGKYLVSFSLDQHCVELYYYNYRPSSDEPRMDSFFHLKYRASLTAGIELLCKDFCIFTTDGKFMILSSALPATQNSPIQNPTSLDFIPSLDDVTFHVLEIESGKTVHKTRFSSDYIYLSHHSGVHLHGPYLAVTSIQHQCIKVYSVNSRGELVFVAFVGSWLYPGDECMLGRTNGEAILGLKQRILAHLFRTIRGRPDVRRQFYLDFQKIRTLIMWKSQFLDPHHLLIKFGSPEYIIGRSTDPAAQTSYYVVYNIQTTQVVAVFNNSSEELLRLYIEHADYFCPSHETRPPCPGLTLPSNNIYEQANIRRLYSTICNSKHGGGISAIRRILSSLPFPNQCHSESAYFDASLFRFDEKTISALEKPKPSTDFAVKFYSRSDHRMLFKLHLAQISAPKTRKHIDFVIHPTDPFIISIQHSHQQPTIVNYHYRI